MQATIEGSEGLEGDGIKPASRGPWPSGVWGDWLRSRSRLLGVCGALLGGVVVSALLVSGQRVSVAARLSVDDLRLVETPLEVEGARGALLVAESEAGLGDVMWLEGPLEDGAETELVAPLHNLTNSSGARETELQVVGGQAFYKVLVGERLDALERLDFAGNKPPREFGARLRYALSNWQRTGRTEGIARERYRFTRPVDYARLRVEGGHVVVDAGLSGRARISLADGSVERGSDLLERQPSAATVPDWVPWLVDRARAVSWIGPEAIAWLEQRAFGVRDQLQRAYRKVHEADGAAEAARALALPAGMPAPTELGEAGGAEAAGFPPADLEPLLAPPVDGEGAWRPVSDDPFVRSWPGGAPLFYQTFLRGDLERPYNQTYLTLWDPRVLQLHVVSGVEEPISATGETGKGTIPKDPQTLSRLVAAFNGGFQALHGEFGMMAEGRVYLPPKPWAATVAVFRDGSVGMGSWPPPAGSPRLYDEARAVAEIPADMLSMRQNLTSLVEDGKVNPWGRWWWGAAPSGSSEQTLTQRSALCLRGDGLMLYAWGDFMEPDALGQVLAAAGCVRAMHLDMNAGHTGLELYNVLAPGESRLPVERVRRFEHEGPLRAHPGYVVRARRAVTSMQMPLPRFIHVDPRDFFYLTLKPSLPGPPPEGAPNGVGFETRGLPGAGYPPAAARYVEGDVRVLRLDPRRLTLPGREASSGAQAKGHALVQLGLAPGAAGGVQLYLRTGALEPEVGVGQAPADAHVLAHGPALAEHPSARAWVGVDAHGFLVYAESNAPELAPWSTWLDRLGVERAVALTPAERLGLHLAGRLWTPDGKGPLLRPKGTRIVDLAVRTTGGARVLFPDTEPKPYRHWAFLQDQRVRYFRTEPPSARAPSAALAPGARAPEETSE